MSKRAQPVWTPPKRNGNVLKLFNSLTRQKEEFIPQHGNRVLWYSCGPTVYDASHMGHARSYMSFDILRHVLSDYFNYDVLYVMNITDIDDKIIKRARINYLYEKYIEHTNNTNFQKSLENIQQVMIFMEEKCLTFDEERKKNVSELLNKVKCEFVIIKKSLEANEESVAKEKFDSIRKTFRDTFAEWLDEKYGATIDNEDAIFNELPLHWEDEFHKDMDLLNVQRPNVLTRVSEYIPEIIDYVKKIIDNGLAYESNGSVYFDVGSFDKMKHHHYAKLVPEAYGDATSLQEGEGVLSSEDRLKEKKSPTDFALWKSSKPGEPWWSSPWGNGRPGWHIECSVMASSICGSSIDIHTGGVDLKFPHHDNELAQAEAYFDHSHWINYFLHTGHLTISGCKMSKSLKNFQTIKDALSKHTARQLRLAFLLHSWKDTLDYSENTMEMAVQYEKFLNEFFLNIKCLIRPLKNYSTTSMTFNKWNQREMGLDDLFNDAKDKIHAALCDNIDTRAVLDVIREFIGYCNVYMKDIKSANILLLRDIAIYITKIFRIFGAISSSDNKEIGFPIDGNAESINSEEILMPHLEILANFRSAVRDNAKVIKAVDILRECDKLRDEILPEVGVRLEDDLITGDSKIKLVNRDELLLEIETKRRIDEEKKLSKEKRKYELIANEAKENAKLQISPEKMFLDQLDKYSKFDNNGLPTHDNEGKELSKGLMKKLRKLQIQQEKKFVQLT